MTKRVGIIGSNSSAVTLPGWNDYEFQNFERSFMVKGVIQGIGSAFAVAQRGAGANLSVDVPSGRALIQITNTNVSHGKTYLVYWDSDATINVGVTTADLTNPRKDRVVLRVDVSQNPDGSSSNIAILEVIAGTPAGSPVAPATPANALSLAIIDVPAGDTTISTGQITDDRVFATLSTSVLRDLARTADLSSTANAKGASMIGIEDAIGGITATNVEAALAELNGKIPTGLNLDLGDGSDGAATISSNTNLDPTLVWNYTTLM